MFCNSSLARSSRSSLEHGVVPPGESNSGACFGISNPPSSGTELEDDSADVIRFRGATGSGLRGQSALRSSQTTDGSRDTAEASLENKEQQNFNNISSNLNMNV